MLIKISIIWASRRTGPPRPTPHTPEGPKHFSPSRNLPFPLRLSQSLPLSSSPSQSPESLLGVKETASRIFETKNCKKLFTNLRAEGREKQRFSKLCSLYYPLSLPYSKIFTFWLQPLSTNPSTHSPSFCSSGWSSRRQSSGWPLKLCPCRKSGCSCCLICTNAMLQDHNSQEGIIVL